MEQERYSDIVERLSDSLSDEQCRKLGDLGLYSAAQDGTPDAPNHDDEQWQTDFRRTEG